MRRLIVNADDFGFSPSTNAGIRAAHLGGIVTATTCMVNLDGFEDARAVARECPRLDLGLHVNLTWGSPVDDAPLPKLAPAGRFLSKRALALALSFRRIPADELRREIRAQVQRFTRAFGPPSHLDLHQHLHAFRPLREVVVELVREFRIPWLRWPLELPARGMLGRWISRQFRADARPAGICTTDHFRGLYDTGRWTDHALTHCLSALPVGTTELMMHPGDDDSASPAYDRLAQGRSLERDLLTRDHLRAVLQHGRIHLTNFRELAFDV